MLQPITCPAIQWGCTHLLAKHVGEGRSRGIAQLQRNFSHAAPGPKPLQGPEQTQTVTPLPQIDTQLPLETPGQGAG